MSEPSHARVRAYLAAQAELSERQEADDCSGQQVEGSQGAEALTEEGREGQDERIETLQRKFDDYYSIWKTRAKLAKQYLSLSRPLDDVLQHYMEGIKTLSDDVSELYEELSNLTPPSQVTRLRVERCRQISKEIVTRLSNRLRGQVQKEEDWPDEVFSLSQATRSKASSSRTLKGACTSDCPSRSSRSSVRQQAAAEAAASQAALKVFQEQERERLEIQRLEAEVKKRAAEQEALAHQRRLEKEAEDLKLRMQRETEELRLRLEKEAEDLKLRMQREADEAKLKAQQEQEYAALQRALEEKKSRVQQLEGVKACKASQAKMQVYGQTGVTADATRGETESVQDDVQVDSPVPIERVLPVPLGDDIPERITSRLEEAMARLEGAMSTLVSSKCHSPQASPQREVKISGLEEAMASLARLEGAMSALISSKRHSPQALPHQGVKTEEHASSSSPVVPQSRAKASSQVVASPVPTGEGSTVLANAIAGALDTNRVPIPEPAVFRGDPLGYSDWKVSFQRLIDRKNIPDIDKLQLLRSYVDGPPKDALDQYFILGADDSYASAWAILDKRFGDPFVLSEAHRKKLGEWPKIASNDAFGLRRFADFLCSCEASMRHIKALEILNDCHENRKMIAKLPAWLASGWSRKVAEIKERERTNRFPTFSQFVAFITKEADIVCDPVTSLQPLQHPDRTDKPNIPRPKQVRAKTLAVTAHEKTQKTFTTCLFCKKPKHNLSKCRGFLGIAVADRVNFIQAEKLCYGCLKPGHCSKECPNRNVCERCGGRHPTCLHEDRAKNRDDHPQSQNESHPADRPSQSGQAQEPRSWVNVVANTVVGQNSSAPTMTIVPVWLSSSTKPEEVLVYALLDPQSNTTFVLSEVADSLRTAQEPVKLQLSTMSSRTKVIRSYRLLDLQVRGLNSSKRINLPPTYVREYIPASRAQIPTNETAKAWPHLERLQSEIAPLQDCEVGLLIGCNCLGALAPREFVCGETDEPYAQRTDLGWCIVGHCNPWCDYEDAIGVSHRIVVKEVFPEPGLSVELRKDVHYVNRTKVRDITPSDIVRALETDFSEKFIDDNPVSQEDLKFLTKLETSIKRNEGGHYEMPLPFREEKPGLPDNQRCAAHRLKCLERRLRKDKTYYDDYTRFMNDIISKGDAEKVPDLEIGNRPAWYIPHHGVYHPHKPGKIRVVFDASAKYQGTSLNDHLLTGPDLTNTLVGVLCRFRRSFVAFICDIERMFHQFHVSKEYRDYLRFLWWEQGDLESTPAVYRMRVHIFGAASSPGCANFGLKYLAEQGRGQFQENTIRFIQRHFYVDDGLISVPTEAEAVQLIHDSRELCATGNLRLHKFVSNSDHVMATIPEEERATVKELDMSLSLPRIERALGVEWCVTSDAFKFRVQAKANPLTRRGILSTVASVYDPLGFIAPFILLGKQILQQMCRDKVGWDQELPEHLKPLWEVWIKDLPSLSDVRIPRCFIPTDFGQVKGYELHHFADASVNGYGACTYLRAINRSDQVHCCLVMAKSRVTPTKVITIPRLELSAAVVAVRVSDLLKAELEIPNIREFFWTDSTVVLGYINNDARRFQVFVANRIQRIKSSTRPEQWAYVASGHNPADHVSRGLTAEQLKSSDWFEGPAFLWERELPDREVKVGEIKEDDPELRRAFVCTTNVNEDRTILDKFEKFSEWSGLIRALTILRRRVKEHKGEIQRSKGNTTLEERAATELFVIKLVQEKAFAKEIKALKADRPISKTKDKLYKLSPFLDGEGVLRVGGRLSQAVLHPHVKHAAILPKDSHVSTLLIRHFHSKVQHQGRGMTMNELRANGWWIIGSSRAVSSYIFKCVKCRKYRGKVENQIMGDLPIDRTEPTPPFTYVGMDCFGPIHVKDGRKELKRYGLILTCLCSRAIHIEVVDDLSTDSFLNALRAFIAIRGNVRQLRCDKGTNFVGAQREFANLIKDMDQEKVRALGCEFLMNPPSASHMGGVWERQIRTIRSVLLAVLDQSAKRLDSTSLRTLLYEVMAIVNSRPLSVEHLSDPTGPEPLTPNHILTMKSTIMQPPPGEFMKDDLYLQKRWKRVQYLANEFWTRWRKEYLLNLQPRPKWNTRRRDLKINDVVLLQEDLAPRNEWKLAKVTDVYPGLDSKVRKVRLLVSEKTYDEHNKATIKTVSLERPIHKVVVLLEAD